MKLQDHRRGTRRLTRSIAAMRAAARARRGRILAVAAIFAVAISGSVVGQPTQPAWAVDYPSWQDVEAARGNEAAKVGEIDRIHTLLAQLSQQVIDTQAIAVQKGEEYNAAQQAYDEAAYKAQQLQLQADEAQATAAESKTQAGQLAARLVRQGGGDVSASLFFDSGSADDLLSQLGMASKISDSSAGIYAKAVRDQNTAQSLTDQANVAKDALKELADAAAIALDEANAAADAAAAALAEQQENEAVLNAQLAVLVENRAATERDYQAGVEYRAEQARIAEAAAAQARAAEAAARAAAGLPAAISGPSGSGWQRPASGSLRDGFGWRIHPVTGVRTFHEGTDIGAGCGWPIYAAHSGTVVMAGPNGNYGNYIRIDNGDGTTTAYGHIVNGGILVGRGQNVAVGQQIARVGSTGRSTGCHLHFEIRARGNLVDPVPFMRSMGAPLG